MGEITIQQNISFTVTTGFAAIRTFNIKIFVTYQWSVATGAANSWEFNTIYRTPIAFSEGEVSSSVHGCILCT